MKCRTCGSHFSSKWGEDDYNGKPIVIEIDYPNMDQVALVFSPFKSGSKTGYIGVLGPARMKYSYVLPSVRYTRNLLHELGSNW